MKALGIGGGGHSRPLAGGSTPRAHGIPTTPKAPKDHGPVIERAEYVYWDETGHTPLYRKRRVKYADGFKATPFERYEGGRWIGGAGCMAGVRRVLYRLPWLLVARRVFVVEGEKCVDLLNDFSIVATCNDSGAGKWAPEFTECFRDKDVVILPDNDDPGRRHAALVARSLVGVARTIKVIELPGLGPKEDVFDWLLSNGETM